MGDWKRSAAVNLTCGAFTAMPVIALGGPAWAAWAVIGIVYAVFTASDRVARIVPEAGLGGGGG